MQAQYPKSVSQQITSRNPALWHPTKNLRITDQGAQLIAGSSFVDPADPFGSLGNPFAVVLGQPQTARPTIAHQVNTPETVFVNACQAIGNDYSVNLTVLTPSGTEMGACAHGFLGALHALVVAGRIAKGAAVHITTTLNTTATATVSVAGDIALRFQAQPAQQLNVAAHDLAAIYGVSLGDFKNHGVLSVGSPKLTLEVSPHTFDLLQQQLSKINYESLLTLQDSHKINGIHIFCRNQAGLPAKCFQNNAYSGPDNLADRATGVSNAAQISADTQVKTGQSLQVTQYSFDGPSAILTLTKEGDHLVGVGGAVQLFNTQVV